MQEIEILKEISKDSKMGMDSVTMVTKKVQDEKFKELIKVIKTMDKNSVDYKKIEEMFKLLNMNIQDGLNEIGLENVKIVNLIQLLKMAYDE